MNHSAISNARADRAGSRFREWALLTPAKRDAALPDILGEIEIIETYRALHEYPLRKVAMGVRQMIQTELGAAAPGSAPILVDSVLAFRLSRVRGCGG